MVLNIERLGGETSFLLCLHLNFKMSRYFLLLFFVISSGHFYAQTLAVKGTVSAAGVPQDDVLIDVSEYNSPIKTLHTDSRGGYSLSLIKGKEYILVFYKSGFILQSISLTDSKLHLATTYSLSIYLVKDEKSPDGLYFIPPVRRISTDSAGKEFVNSRFSTDKILPQHRADSVLVLLNRAKGNQYILVSNMKLGSNNSNAKYSQEIEADIRKEIAADKETMKQINVVYDSLGRLEEKHRRASMTTTDTAQFSELIETQRLLAERLSKTADHYLVEQQQMLAKARLDELIALKSNQDLPFAKDSSEIRYLSKAATNATSSAINERYRAMDANRKFQLYNNYQSLNYQEYIEMLLYKNRMVDTAGHTASKHTESKPQHVESVPQPAKSTPQPVRSTPQPAMVPPKQYATITPKDTSDNLSRMTDEQRTNVIKQALEEEKRFENYAEKTEVRNIGGESMTVKDIHIADDNYEVQTDKKGRTKYLKNGKPVSKLTFEFETKRKMVDVLNTIKEVDKFGK